MLLQVGHAAVAGHAAAGAADAGCALAAGVAHIDAHAFSHGVALPDSATGTTHIPKCCKHLQAAHAASVTTMLANISAAHAACQLNSRELRLLLLAMMLLLVLRRLLPRLPL